jgi:hypothetical protein
VARSELFQCCGVVLCDTRRRDVGTPYTLHIDAAGPTGRRWAPAGSTKFQIPSAMKFMVLTQIALPIEPNGGRHVYSFRLEGSHEPARSPRPGKRSLTTCHPLGFAEANRS